MATGRRAQRASADRAAKERRDRIIAIGGVVVLGVVLAFEVPSLLHHLNKGSGSSSVPAPVVTTPSPAVTATAAKARAAYRAALKSAPHDIFAAKQGGTPSTLGSVSTPPGLHDPFAKPNSSAAEVAPAAPKPVTASPLPGTIVIGTPGAGKTLIQGWIVILASIPTAQGQTAANDFATSARKDGLGKVSVLNSSNRKPLRGGYWVVYTGPYNTLGEVSTAADHIHASGYKTAYIRQLVMYKAKAAPATKKKTATKKKK